MRIRDRINALSDRAAAHGAPPVLFILSGDEAYAGGERTTIEAWGAEYGEQARRDFEAGRIRYTGIDFRPDVPTETLRP